MRPLFGTTLDGFENWAQNTDIKEITQTDYKFNNRCKSDWDYTDCLFNENTAPGLMTEAVY